MRLWYSRTGADESLQHECKTEHHGPNALHADREPKFDPSGSVRVIRLSDDGLFANRCELTDVLYAIRNPPRPVLAVWYIHGWKHNAESGRGDLREFKNLVTQLKAQQETLSEEDQRHVTGVYIGWDGGVGPRGPLQNATFYNRKRAADQISQSAILTKIIAMAKYAREQRGTPNDMMVMIGHSFGARILYSATSQVLIDQVQRHHPGEQKWSYSAISGPADLIVLLNPAFEASMFTAINSVRREGKSWESFDLDRQQPLLLVIATENDLATKYVFPLAKILGHARKGYQRQTVGNYDKYVTHSLTVKSFNGRQPITSTCWFDSFETNKLRLQRNPSSDKNPQERGNPFIVASTTSDVIHGHSGIWKDEFRAWMISFVRELQRRRVPHK